MDNEKQNNIIIIYNNFLLNFIKCNKYIYYIFLSTVHKSKHLKSSVNSLNLTK